MFAKFERAPIWSTFKAGLVNIWSFRMAEISTKISVSMNANAGNTTCHLIDHFNLIMFARNERNL